MSTIKQNPHETSGIEVIVEGVAWLPEQHEAMVPVPNGPRAGAGGAADDVIICISPCPGYNSCGNLA